MGRCSDERDEEICRVTCVQQTPLLEKFLSPFIGDIDGIQCDLDHKNAILVSWRVKIAWTGVVSKGWPGI